MAIETTTLITTLSIVIFLLSMAFVLVAAFINYGNAIESGTISTLLDLHVPAFITGSVLRSYKIPKRELVSFGVARGDEFSKLNKVGAVKIDGKLRSIGSVSYPFYFKARNIGLPNTSALNNKGVQDLRMLYVIRYGVKQSKTKIDFSRNTYFNPLEKFGGTTFNTLELSTVFKGPGLAFGQPCIMRVDNNFVHPNMLVSYGVRFFQPKEKISDDGVVYIVSKTDTTIDPEATFSNPAVRIGFTSDDPNDSFDLTKTYFPALMKEYNILNGYDTAPIVPQDELSFTSANSFLLVPLFNNLSAAIIDYSVKNSLISASGENSARIAQLQKIAESIIVK